MTEPERDFNAGVEAARAALVAVAAVIPPSYAIGRAALEVIIEGVDGLKFSDAEGQRQ